jgi:arylsulfatase A-like enzyme
MQAPRSYADASRASRTRTRRVYLGMIAVLDDAIGQLLATLDRIGVADDTLSSS